MCGSCRDYGAAAERQFTEQIAARDLETFRAKGAGSTTRLLRDGLIRAGQVDGVVLDIGTTSVRWHSSYLGRATQAIAVDASPAYSEAASREGPAELSRRDSVHSRRFP